jgi:hypothetical protein
VTHLICCGSLGDDVAHSGMCWLTLGCGGSEEVVLARSRVWWLNRGDLLIPQGTWWVTWGLCGSVGHVVAQLRMLWINFRCVGTTVGDVVAQNVILSIENVVPY